MGMAEDRAAAKLLMMQNLMKEKGIKNSENVTSIQDVNAAKKDTPDLASAAMAGIKAKAAAENPTPGLADSMAAGLSALRGVDPNTAKQLAPGSGEKLGELASPETADQLMRVTAGGLGDVAAGTMTGLMQGDPSSIPANIQEEARKTAKAKMMLALKTGGSTIPNAAEFAGEAGQMLALPGKWVETPLKAMATGGAFAGVQSGIDRLREGEPLLERPVDYASDVGLGAAGGLGGYYLGKMATKVISRLGGGNKTLTEAADRLIENNQKIVNESLTTMNDSKIALNKIGLNALQKKITNDLGGVVPATKWLTPHSHPAFKEISDLVAKGEPISLRVLNDIRERTLRDAVFDKTGLAKDTAQMTDIEGVFKIAKSIDDFITNLPMKRNYMLPGAKVADGVKAWKTMKEFNQYVFRNERLMTLVAKAESKASTGNISFENSLQNEFLSFYNKNRVQMRQWFTQDQIFAIERIAKGDLSKKFFNKLDRMMGGTFWAPATRGAQGLFGAMFEGPESKIAAEKVLENAAGKVSKAKAARVIPQLGAIAGTVGLKQ